MNIEPIRIEWNPSANETARFSYSGHRYAYKASTVDLCAENQMLHRIVGNLFKKIKFMELYGEFANEQISEDEFEKEIDGNSEKYIIEASRHISSHDLHIALGILEKYKKFIESKEDACEVIGLSVDIKLSLD
jgi:hypothetical protein